MTRDGHDDEGSSTRSSNITALPRWENIRNARRSRIILPLPVRPQRSHVRKDSQTPILGSTAFEKESLFSPSSLQQPGSQLPDGGVRSEVENPDEQGKNRKSRTVVWLILAIVVLLLLAIILGAVLGTMIHPSSSAPHPSVTEIPAGAVPAPTESPPGNGDSPVPTSPPQLPSVAVTGWAVPGSQGYYSVWLFWQNSKGYLSRASYNSSTGNWTRVSNFAEARKDTPLAAAALNAKYYDGQENYSFADIDYQTSIVYLDDKNYLKEWVFPDAGPEVGRSGALTKQREIAHENTSLGYYWPQLVYQGMSGEVRSAYFECHRKDQCWHEQVLDTTEAKNGTRLVTVPMENELESVGVFYAQEENGRVVNYKEDSSQESRIWENGAYSNLIPQGAAMAAFSTRSSSNTKTTNTYLLWQDVNGTIQMSWTEGEDGEEENNNKTDDEKGGWKGPMTHPALAGADKNTALACLTGLTFPGFSLTPGTELARCYFQTGLALREVSFDGESWDIVGVVPIDV